MEYKEIKADVGKRLEFDNGSVVYVPDYTNDGYYYKDNKAFEEGKGICYIREAIFMNEESGLVVLNKEDIDNPPEDICNRKQFIDLCTENVGRYKSQEGAYFGNEAEEEGFIQRMAEILFGEAEWAGIDMYIDDFDLTEFYVAYKNNEL